MMSDISGSSPDGDHHAPSGSRRRIRIGLYALPFTLASFPALAMQAEPPAQATLANDDIVVTAQRREERLQDIPISISAVTAQQLTERRISGIDDLTSSVAGMRINQNGAAGQVFLRGVGANVSAAGNESPVAIYVDDVYIPTQFGNRFSFNSVEQVAVLKGPQGTLFGRNATAGVIQITSRTPHGTLVADGDISYGNYDTVEARAYVGGSLTDTLAADISGYFRAQNDGWGKNLFNGADVFTSNEKAIRSKWVLSLPRTTVTLIGDYSRHRSSIGTALQMAPGIVAIDGVTIGKGGFDVTNDLTPYSVTKGGGVSLKIEHNLDWADFVSISAWRKSRNYTQFDVDATNSPLVHADEVIPEKAISQEFRLASRGDGPVTWLVGAYYFHYLTGLRPLNLFGLGIGPDTLSYDSRHRTNSISGFAQASVALGEQTRLTLGYRYTHDKIRLRADQTFGAIPLLDDFTQRETFNKSTFRLALDHRFSPDAMAYASFTRGFKSGLYSLSAPTAPAVRPEVLDAYEAGIKTQIFDRRLSLNMAAFLYKYDDIQLQALRVAALDLVNAAKAELKGVEIEASARVTPAFSLFANATYTDSEFTRYLNAPFFRIGENGEYLQNPEDATGNRLPNAPKFSASFGFRYTAEMAAGTLTLNASDTYSSSYFYEANNQFRQRAYHLVNASLRWAPSSERWNVTFWGKNLADEVYPLFLQTSTTGVPISPSAPRTYGVSVGFQFR